MVNSLTIKAMPGCAMQVRQVTISTRSLVTWAGIEGTTGPAEEWQDVPGMSFNIPLDSPAGLAVDPSGNLLIADRWGWC